MIYHITSSSAWEKAQELGRYIAPSLADEGFIHCSTRQQILAVANNFFRGQGELLLLCVDERHLTSKLVWEAPVHPKDHAQPEAQLSRLFPHIYGAIELSAVADVCVFRQGADGFSLPMELPR